MKEKEKDNMPEENLTEDQKNLAESLQKENEDEKQFQNPNNDTTSLGDVVLGVIDNINIFKQSKSLDVKSNVVDVHNVKPESWSGIDNISQSPVESFSGIESGETGFLSSLSSAVGDLATATKNVANSTLETATNATTNTMNMVGDVASGTMGVASNVASSAVEVASKTMEVASTVASSTVEVASKTMEVASNVASSTVEVASNVASSTVEVAGSVASGALEVSGDIAVGAVKIVGGILEGL